MSNCLCDSCAALCCRYFALPIDNPKTRRQYDDIRWYLCHENVCVFIEKRQWYIGISNRCKHLQADNRCGIYLTRPKICREYSTDNCDYHGGEYDFEKLFTSAEQLERYARRALRKRALKRRLKAAAAAAAPAREGAAMAPDDGAVGRDGAANAECAVNGGISASGGGAIESIKAVEGGGASAAAAPRRGASRRRPRGLMPALGRLVSAPPDRPGRKSLPLLGG